MTGSSLLPRCTRAGHRPEARGRHPQDDLPELGRPRGRWRQRRDGLHRGEERRQDAHVAAARGNRLLQVRVRRHHGGTGVHVPRHRQEQVRHGPARRARTHLGRGPSG